MKTKKDKTKDAPAVSAGEMTIITALDMYNDGLESFREKTQKEKWVLAIEGYWRESMYHNGYISYYIQEYAPGSWAMKTVSRNTMLDDVTEEDVEEGRLNDDQAQALWDRTLEEAQNDHCDDIVAVALGVAEGMPIKEVAEKLYAAAMRAECPHVREVNGGLMMS